MRQAVTLCEDENFVPRDVILGHFSARNLSKRLKSQTDLLQELPDNPFRLAVRVDVGGVNCVYASVPGSFQKRDGLRIFNIVHERSGYI